MRHVMRYNHQPDFGIIYTGDGDQAYLERWCQRTALKQFYQKRLAAAKLAPLCEAALQKE